MIITITGPDRCGKETQTKIVTGVLNRVGIPAARLEFPDYDTPIGKYAGAMLDNVEFHMYSDSGKGLRHGDLVWQESKGGPSVKYQLLMLANEFDLQEKIRPLIAEGKVVICDRYYADSIIYGMVDCNGDISLVDASHKFLELIPDEIIILNGKGYDRPGEVPDDNEKRADFQSKVRKAAKDLAWYRRWSIIDVDRYPDIVEHGSMADIAESILLILKHAGLDIDFAAAHEAIWDTIWEMKK